MPSLTITTPVMLFGTTKTRIGNEPVFYKTSFDCGIIYLKDLPPTLDNIRSLEIFKSRGLNTNFFDRVSITNVCS